MIFTYYSNKNKLKGHILDVIGQYYANGSNNDASIVKHIFENDPDVSSFFRSNDIFVVDRGFRDCIEYLESKSFVVKMPYYLEKGKKQHSTLEANESRLVTKTRWVVEAVNGLVKKWQYFNNVVKNVNVPNIASDFRIICAIINKYKPPRLTDTNESQLIAKTMLEKATNDNHLMKKVANFMRKSSKKKSVDVSALNFPKLSIEFLKNYTMGSYQIKQASSYAQDHLDDEGLYQYEYVPQTSNIVKVLLKSKHVSNKEYRTFIEYNNKNRNEPITGHYCDCKSGARVVGCCAHVASVLWFLGIAKNKLELLKPNRSSKFRYVCKDARGSLDSLEFD